MIAVYIAVGVAVLAVVGWLLLRKTLRTRLAMNKSLAADPDINDWLIVFNWTLKILYVPTIVASLFACLLMFMYESGWSVFSSINPKAVGGVWFAILFVNFLIEEYNISIKVLFLGMIGVGCLLLWLHLLGWVGGFLRLFTRLPLSMSGTAYLLVTVVGLLTIGVSWLQGLFYYATITPNYMNLQQGPTESGEQIGREDYNTRVDTSDFLERLLGFGRIVITFKEQSRQPITLLVWRVQKKAALLEKVRGKFAIDYPQQNKSPA